MKKLFAFLLIPLLVLVSCERNEQPAAEASISLELVKTTVSSVEFNVETENAASFFYSITLKDATSEEYTEVKAENGVSVKCSREGLEENSEYVLTAYAVNADGVKSNEETVSFKTNAGAAITIKPLSKTSESVTFSLSPLNAGSYSYAVVEASSDPETAELANRVEGGEKGEFTQDGLKQNTNYVIVAEAYNLEGESSGRVYEPVKTEIEPVVSIEEIVPASNSATAKLVFGNAVRFHYAVSEGSSDEPESSEFVSKDLTDNNVSLLLQNLEPEKEYTLYVKGENSNGYIGKSTSGKFTTLEYIKLPVEIASANITMFDADFTVSFDHDKYVKCYYVVRAEKEVGNIEEWDWQMIVDYNPRFLKVTGQDIGSTLSDCYAPSVLNVETTYMVGAVPVLTDGKLDLEAAVWHSVPLKAVTFGESTAECSLQIKGSGYDNIKFSVSNVSGTPVGYYCGCIQGSFSDNAALAEKIKPELVKKMQNTYDQDTVWRYLSPGSAYTVYIVPRDGEDKLGNISSAVYETKALDYTSQAGCQVEIASVDVKKITFNCTFLNKEVTKKILYYSQEYDEYYNESRFLERLKVDNDRYLETDGSLDFSSLMPEKEYVFGFAPVDEYGVAGDVVILRQKTNAYVFDGDANAKVEITITSLVEKPEYKGYYVKYKAVPNQYVSKYFVTVKSNSNPWLDDSRFASDCEDGVNMEYTEETEITGYDGNGEFVTENAEIWVLAYDHDGRLCKIEKTRIEETWK